MSSESLENIPLKPEKEIKKFGKKRIAIVDTSDALDAQARDIAEEKLTASKQELKGFKGFVTKIWKHNWAREYYRQKEIAVAKKEIITSGNLYVGENKDQKIHEEAMNSIVERFVSEYNETIHTEAGEEKTILDKKNPDDERLNNSIHELIKNYASNKINEKIFDIESNKIISEVLGLSGEKLKNTVNHTDNLFQIAKDAKLAVEHGASLDEIDQGIEIIVGKAKVGVRTEAKLNAVDRITEKIQSTKIGSFVNEATVAAGVAIAYATFTRFSQFLLRNRAVAWGTLGASAAVGGVIAGARESLKVEEERKQHSRERAKGKEVTKDMRRRMEMEKAIYKTTSAKFLYESLNKLSNNINSTEEYFNAVNMLAEVETRINISDTENIDLLSYSNSTSVDQERYNLDIARAEAKIKLRKMVADGEIKTPNGKSFDEVYSSVMHLQSTNIHEGNEGMETRDRVFKKMKTKKVAAAAVKAVAAGLLIGGAIQEVTSLINPNQEGMIENVLGTNRGARGVTALEGIRRWFTSDNIGERAISSSTVLANGTGVHLSDGVDLVPNTNAHGEFILTKDGEVLSEHIKFNGSHLTPESEEILGANNINIKHDIVNLDETAGTGDSAQEIINKNPDLFNKIHRMSWLDENTPQPDLNELELDYGGQNGTGIDSGGNFVMSIKGMTSGGSFHENLSVDAPAETAAGNLKMLLSLSKDSQADVIVIPIDVNGNVVLDPNSNIAKMLFSDEGGQLNFKGGFIEIAHPNGVAPDGGIQYEILSTVIGKTENIALTVNQAIDPPFYFPVWERTPFERLKNPKDNEELSYSYNGFSGIKRDDYEVKMIEALKNNPDATLDEKNEIKNYLSRQKPEHIKNIDDLVKESGPMDSKCKLSVCIPVAGHQEGKNIYKTLQNYLKQTANNDDFEIVLFVNQPDIDKEGKKVMPDDTMSEINRFKKEHPEINVRVMNKVIPIEQAKIGYIRKLLTDAVLQRNLARGDRAKDHIIVSNDADNKGMAKEYIKNYIDKFEKNPNTDAFMGQLDWDLEAYARNPLIHIGTRLFQFAEFQLRKGDQAKIASSGANFAFRPSIYAGVNGYSPDSTLGEDVELGRAIKASRIGAKDKRAIDSAGANVSRLLSDARRAEKALKDGLAPVEQWNKGFSAFDSEVRKTDWATASKEINYDDPKAVKKLVDDIEIIVNRTLKAMTWVSGAEQLSLNLSAGKKGKNNLDSQIFKRSLGWLGIKYEVVGPKEIKIVDARNLIKGLKKYKGDVADILKKKIG